VVGNEPLHPSAKIPAVLLPAAEPHLVATVAAVAEVTAQVEKVYLSRVVTLTVVKPSAKMPNVPSNTGVTLLLEPLMGEGPKLFNANMPKV
jgi:hypothetical protein